MTEKKREIAQRILVSLYDAWFGHTIISLDPIRETSGLEDGIFHMLVNKLEDRHGFIKAYGSSYTYEITPSGILYVEDNELISRDIVDKHRNVRNAVIAHLTKLFDSEGFLADASVDELAAAARSDKFEILQDMSFLNKIGYVRDTINQHLSNHRSRLAKFSWRRLRGYRLGKTNDRAKPAIIIDDDISFADHISSRPHPTVGQEDRIEAFTRNIEAQVMTDALAA